MGAATHGSSFSPMKAMNSRGKIKSRTSGLKMKVVLPESAGQFLLNLSKYISALFFTCSGQISLFIHKCIKMNVQCWSITETSMTPLAFVPACPPQSLYKDGHLNLWACGELLTGGLVEEGTEKQGKPNT